MPTTKVDGFEIVIHTRDEHSWPHVHVWRAEDVVVINLGDENTAPSIDETKRTGMSKKDVRRALGLVIERQEVLLDQWRKIWRAIHGEVENK